MQLVIKGPTDSSPKYFFFEQDEASTRAGSTNEIIENFQIGEIASEVVIEVVDLAIGVLVVGEIGFATCHVGEGEEVDVCFGPLDDYFGEDCLGYFLSVGWGVG